MKKLIVSAFAAFLLWVNGCADLREEGTFNFNSPSSVVARAWQHIEQGRAREEGAYKREHLRLAHIDYARDGASVEVAFYIISSFRTQTDGHAAWKTLDVEMDKAGKFLSASIADCGQGGGIMQ